ncbi:MAG: hypothetical protein JRE18_12440 [Deltaproteobacteria bacterium]|jgi:hypothetical protein|nr:hypothetical protein [Deltaproteobacteria bacterium]
MLIVVDGLELDIEKLIVVIDKYGTLEINEDTITATTLCGTIFNKETKVMFKD